MPTPDVGDVHVNRLLSNLSIAWANAPDAFVADRVFPFVYVPKQSDLYPVFGRGTFFADPGQAMIRAPGAPTAIVGYSLSNNPYYANNYAIGSEIPDELRGNVEDVFDLDENATQLVTDIQRIRLERGFATDFMKTGVWATDTSVSNKWSDYGASDPLGDLRAGIRTVQLATGRRANKLVMGRIVWDRLVDHPDIVDRINGGATTGQPAIATREMLARLLELDEVIVGDAVYDAAASNVAGTVTMTRILDDDALLLFAPRNPGRMMPAAGYTFVWESAMNGRQAPWFIRKWRDDKRRRDVVEAHAYWDQVAVDTNAGVFFPDVVD